MKVLFCFPNLILKYRIVAEKLYDASNTLATLPVKNEKEIFFKMFIKSDLLRNEDGNVFKREHL
jgi:hypothetical protein